MTEGPDIRASHDEVEAFVGKLRELPGSLGESERAMQRWRYSCLRCGS